MRTLVLLLLPLFSHIAHSAKHSLKFIYIASSGVQNFPEFIGASVVDEAMVVYCDTKIHIKQDWMNEVFEKDPHHLEIYTQACLESQRNYFKETIHSLKWRFNQSEGVHILQRVSGCEWDDETGEFRGFNQYGYNGEDFISFDLETMTWVAPRPHSLLTKERWDSDKARNNFNKYHLTNVFPDWLKTYVDYGKSSLMRKDLPSVSLLQKSPSSAVTCYASGFYPDIAMMFWRKDGEELHEDVDYGGILPNHDGSFQMSADLKVPSDDWGKYECVFQLSGVKEDIITTLDKEVIRTNYKTPSDVTLLIISAVFSVCVLLLIAAATLKKKRVPENDSSELSDRLNPDS